MSDASVSQEDFEAYLSGRLADGEVSVDLIATADNATPRLTHLLTATWEEDGTERSQGVVVRMENETVEDDGSDIRDEYRLQRSLEGTAVPAPETYWFEPDPSHLGERLYVTELVDGRSYRPFVAAHRERLYAEWDSEERRLPNDYVEVLASIHDLDGNDVDGVERRTVDAELDYAEWLYGLTDHRHPILDETLRWLHANAPDVPETTLVHTDLKLDNLLVEDGRINAVVDWHLAHEGDPMRDIGFACCEVFAGNEFSSIERDELCLALFERDWFFERYEQLTGRRVDAERVRFWRTYALFTAVVTRLLKISRFEEKTGPDVQGVFPQYLLSPRLESLFDLVRDDVVGEP